MKFKLTITLSVLCVIFLLSCNTSTAPVIGKWNVKSIMGQQANGGTNYLEINKDQTAIEVNDAVGKVKRTWSIRENEFCLKALVEDGGFEMCGKYKVEGNLLYWNIMDMEFIYEK